VSNFCSHYQPRYRSRGNFIVSPSELFAAQEYVSRRLSSYSGKKSTILGIEHQADTLFRAISHQKRRNRDISKTHDISQINRRKLPKFLPSELDHNGLPLFVQVSFLAIDIQ